MSRQPRSYDATRRRERAEEERRATQRRVVEAARDLFVTRGYVATTVADIAKEAGVALQSVYNAGKSKAALMHLVVDLAVAGDDEEVLLADRSTFTAVAEQPTAERQVEVIAALIAETMQRLAPVWVAYREAAAVDPTGAANLEAAHRRRNETFAAMIGMVDQARLRLPPGEATDTAWAVGSIEVYLLLRSIRGWDHEQYADWLRRTLVNELVRRA
ncbi:MAG TPA: helix-turn-helix domain-containing protein [Nocardioides sp.]|uniref:TetR/AcrR family transcriptional regulator n=1 Tax=Nocardioides sp. TaxID=35761 RepID=UPI002E346F81|nr:helix-turn-helix domain-containing protein [Nocardioides sp.]HEX5088632.1 helix-turn-helix domain-containing protein [Nocardioides sp.]